MRVPPAPACCPDGGAAAATAAAAGDSTDEDDGDFLGIMMVCEFCGYYNDNHGKVALCGMHWHLAKQAF